MQAVSMRGASSVAPHECNRVGDEIVQVIYTNLYQHVKLPWGAHMFTNAHVRRAMHALMDIHTYMYSYCSEYKVGVSLDRSKQHVRRVSVRLAIAS
jgi:hypothetical protein